MDLQELDVYMGAMKEERNIVLNRADRLGEMN